jgi:hypothetical protein
LKDLKFCNRFPASLVFIKTPESSYTIELSQTQEFVFHLSGIPAPKFKWLKDNKDLPLKDRIKFTSEYKNDIYECKLIICGVQPADAGSYKVEATNKCSTINAQFSVVVIGGPVFVRKPADLSAIEKKACKVDCEVNGLPIPSVEW